VWKKKESPMSAPIPYLSINCPCGLALAAKQSFSHPGFYYYKCDACTYYCPIDTKTGMPNYAKAGVPLFVPGLPKPANPYLQAAPPPPTPQSNAIPAARQEGVMSALLLRFTGLLDQLQVLTGRLENLAQAPADPLELDEPGAKRTKPI
jgi:hypothetical protein